MAASAHWFHMMYQPIAKHIQEVMEMERVIAAEREAREAAEAKLAIAREALEFVINRKNLMFAECSDAEEIVTHCREALDKIK